MLGGLGFEQANEAFAVEGVVVDEEDAGHRLWEWYRRLNTDDTDCTDRDGFGRAVV
jgi:hypothetical protein